MTDYYLVYLPNCEENALFASGCVVMVENRMVYRVDYEQASEIIESEDIAYVIECFE